MPSPSEHANRELYEELLNEGASKEHAATIANAVAATEARERMNRGTTDPSASRG